MILTLGRAWPNECPVPQPFHLPERSGGNLDILLKVEGDYAHARLSSSARPALSCSRFAG